MKYLKMDELSFLSAFTPNKMHFTLGFQGSLKVDQEFVDPFVIHSLTMVNGRLWTKMTVMKNTRWSVCPVAGWLAWYHWFDPIPGELVSEWISSPT